MRYELPRDALTIATFTPCESVMPPHPGRRHWTFRILRAAVWLAACGKLSGCLLAGCLADLGLRAGSPASAAEPLAAEIRPHRGRPTVFVDGNPVMLATYSPAGHWRRELFFEQLARYAAAAIEYSEGRPWACRIVGLDP